MVKNIQSIFIERRMAEMINDASIDSIIAFNKEQEIVIWNNSCAATTGIPKEAVTGKNFLDVFSAAAGNKDILKAIDGALRGFRMFVPSDKGSCLGGYHETHFIPLKDDNDEIIGVLCLMHDVAHRVKAENELKALNKALARKNKALKEKNDEILTFSQVTGHDLKEPLRKIYTFIELILSKEVSSMTDASKSNFKRVQASVQRMGMLTDDLLVFAQLGINKNEEMAVLNLDHILSTAKNNLAELIAAKNAVVLAGPLPVITGYRTQLTDLFQRIMSNSLKFHKDGHAPHVSVTVATIKGTDMDMPDAVPEKDYIRISFKDNGIGFEQKYAEKIFMMFQRLHNKDAYSGSGIGLALCKKVMQLHDGFITAEGKEDEGSIFHCFFPVNK